MSLLVILAAAATQAAAEPAAPLPDPAAERGVSSYPPSFFAASSPTTALDMVHRLPGFNFDTSNTARGLSGAGGNVIIDGQAPVSKNDTLEDVLKRIPASAVERIDVIRGGAPGIDMQGKTVIANVIRKSTSGFQGVLQSQLSFIYDGRVNPGFRAEGQWRWGQRLFDASLVSGRGVDDWLGDGPRIRYGPDGQVLIRSEVDDDAEGIRMIGTAAFETPLAGGRLRLNGTYVRNPFDQELTDRLSIPAGREYQYQTVKRHQLELGARYSRDLTERLDLEAVGFHQRTDRDNRDRFESAAFNRSFRGVTETEETVGRLHLRYEYDADLSFETGGEAVLNKLDTTTALIVNGAPVSLPASVEVQEDRSEIFGTVRWRPWATLSTEASLKHEVSTIASSGDVTLENSLKFTKPRIAATWAISPVDQLRLRYELEVSQLSFDDFVANSSVVSTGSAQVGNPDLRPQQAWAFDGTYERRFWTSGSFSLTLRRLPYKDVVDRIPVFGPAGAVADAPGNIGEGTRRVVTINLTVPLDRLGVRRGLMRAQTSKRWSEVVDPVTGAKREISNVRPAEWEVHFTQDLPRWNANWGIDAWGGFRQTYYRLSEIEHQKLDTWVTVFGEYKVRPDLVLRVELQNITERGFSRTREVYAGPRDRAGIAYTDVRDLDFGRVLFVRLRKTID